MHLSQSRLLTIAFALSAFAVGLAPGRLAAADRPNVLFVIADDLNTDLGCYGHPVVQSPNVDRLARSGVRFERAYVQYTVCNPSRTSFLTGLRPETTQVMGNAEHFRKTLPDAVTLPELFRRNGYFTAGLGKVFHRGLSPDEARPEMDDPRSWDHTFYGQGTEAGRTGEGRNLTGGRLAWCRWLAADGTDDDQHDGQIATEAIRLLAEKRDRPFFLAVGFYRPHDPFVSPKKYFDRYPLAKCDPPTDPKDRTPDLPLAIPGGAFRAEFDRFSDREKREFTRSYYAGVSFMDAQLGRLLDALERLKMADNTVVVFLGDHGYHLGVRGWWNKSTLFERSCRTPLIVRDPGAKGNGRAAKGLVEFVDLYPTLVERCGLKEGPTNLEGTSFRKRLDTPALEGKKAAFTVVRRGKALGRTVRTDRWRYTEWDGGKAGAELYDHTTDPGEWKNLARNPENSTVLTQLRQLLR